jgi:hypothetical protein
MLPDLRRVKQLGLMMAQLCRNMSPQDFEILSYIIVCFRCVVFDAKNRNTCFIVGI